MNIPRIVNAIGYIDDDLITAALEDPPRKRHNLMIKPAKGLRPPRHPFRD